MCSRVPVAQNYPERQQVLSKSARDFWGKGYYLHYTAIKRQLLLASMDKRAIPLLPQVVEN